MMKIYVSMLFLIPVLLLNNSFIFMTFLFLFFFMLLMFNVNIFYCSISYVFGMDKLSYLLVLLTIWIILLMLISSYNNANMVMFMLFLYMLMLFLMFSFSCYNLMLFYIFFESSLIPTIFLILGWGYQPERLSSVFYLLFYTLFGSLPLLLSIMYMYNNYGTLYFFILNINLNFYLYLSMVIGFLIKMPMFMFHFWLPKAHVEAPVSGSMILAGVLLKLGGYGLIRVFNFIWSNISHFNLYFINLSLFGGLLISFVCMFQYDIKSMIAYSSVSHMSLVIGGIMTMNVWGIMGSIVLMIGHGLCSSGLFCLANIIYERSNSRSFYLNKGLILTFPSLSMFWFMFCSNNMASPPSLNLFGEILLINSLMIWSKLLMILLGLLSFMSCCYSIYLYSYINHGLIYSSIKMKLNINCREYILLLLHFIPLNILILKPLFLVCF
uniref:NADH-ubiquinone oxidoreductase chain 4 n=1 Tax=Hydrometra greeni TaxID=1492928 RepID=C5HIP5_9HEMI|nr:NADH dehydrogenase subunit 4 [Hydrometra greeni]ACJ69490.1 NADH dehydrogenase subunit 4 [Hydrometra greeni]